MKIIVGISGTSEASLSIRLLNSLKSNDVETHVIVTETAEKILEYETGKNKTYLESICDYVYDEDDFFAPVSSGSFITDGMIVIPCSMKTLSGIANGFSDNLLLRAADVTLKERRKLVLVTRETPLSLIHLRNMEKATEAGAIILPPMLSLYSKPKTIDDVEKHITGKILDVFGIKNNLFKRWGSDE